MEQNGKSEAGRPATVLGRTLKGLALAVGIIGLLLLEHNISAAWLPLVAALPDCFAELVESGGLMVIVLSFLIWFALREYAVIVSGSGMPISGGPIGAAGIFLFVLLWFGFAHRHGMFASCPVNLREPGFNAIMVLCLIAMGQLAFFSVRGRIGGRTIFVALSLLGLIYIVLPLSFLVALRLRWGSGVLFFVLVVCKMADVGAYYCGKLLGGPGFAPVVSPNKTWSGVCGGVLAAVVTASILRLWFAAFLSPLAALLFGFGIAVVAISGDLAESMIKREADVKDSGRVLGGYGGLLDIIDDVLFAAPCAYLFLVSFFPQ